MDRDKRLDKSKVYRLCHKLSTNRFFTYFIILFIVYNNIDLALDKYP